MKRTALTALLLTALATVAMAATPTAQDMLRWVPSTAKVVLAVDGVTLRANPLVQSWLLEHQAGWSGADNDLKRFLADAGLDPMRDVDTMVVASDTQGHGGFALFAGRYDLASLGAAFEKRGGVRETIAGVPAFFFSKDSKDNGGVALVSNELVIAGDQASVRALLGAAQGGGNLAKREIAAGHIDPRAPFWVVVAVPETMRAKASEAAQHVSAEQGNDSVRAVVAASGTVQTVALQAFLDANVHLSGFAVADTAENAELLRDSVKGALATMRLHFQSTSPELVEVLRDVEVRVKGNELSVAGAVPVTLLQKLAAEHSCAPHASAESHR